MTSLKRRHKRKISKGSVVIGFVHLTSCVRLKSCNAHAEVPGDNDETGDSLGERAKKPEGVARVRACIRLEVKQSGWDGSSRDRRRGGKAGADFPTACLARSKETSGKVDTGTSHRRSSWRRCLFLHERARGTDRARLPLLWISCGNRASSRFWIHDYGGIMQCWIIKPTDVFLATEAYGFVWGYKQALWGFCWIVKDGLSIRFYYIYLEGIVFITKYSV